MVFEFEGIALWVLYGVFIALSLSFFFAFVRLVKGPTLADRVVALDLVSYQAIAFIVVYAVASGHDNFIEAGLVLALIAFLGTLAFARYIERTIFITEAEGEDHL